MRNALHRLLWLLAVASLITALHACSVIEDLDEESPSEPSPDELADAVLAPKPAHSLEAIGQGVICPGSFGRFKRRITKARRNPGTGHEWHHIVNQNTTNTRRFGNRLHCTDNLISLPTALHRKVSGHFSEKPPWAKGRFVREVISERDWSAQYEYGLEALRNEGIQP